MSNNNRFAHRRPEFGDEVFGCRIEIALAAAIAQTDESPLLFCAIVFKDVVEVEAIGAEAPGAAAPARVDGRIELDSFHSFAGTSVVRFGLQVTVSL